VIRIGTLIDVEKSVAEAVDQAAAIRHAAGQALKRAPLDQRLRLLGVRVGSLLRAQDAATLADAPAEPAQHALFVTD
jgi:DNA polymerase-4